jgi:hypothetical protein
MNLHDTTDAKVWAEEFVKEHGGDVDLMLTWFANAIMAGKDEQARREEDKIAELEHDAAISKNFHDLVVKERDAANRRVDRLTATLQEFVWAEGTEEGQLMVERVKLLEDCVHDQRGAIMDAYDMAMKALTVSAGWVRKLEPVKMGEVESLIHNRAKEAEAHNDPREVKVGLPPGQEDTVFIPRLGTVRQCSGCGALVGGGPSRCDRCA